MTKFQKINIAGNFLFLFLIKNLSVLMSKPQDKPSALKRESPALQKIKFMNFSDCESGSEHGYRDPPESGSIRIRIPQHCYEPDVTLRTSVPSFLAVTATVVPRLLNLSVRCCNTTTKPVMLIPIVQIRNYSKILLGIY
jgi:hypothetical protein